MAGKVLCPKCLVVVDEDDIGERVCPVCKSRLCPNAHIIEAKICIRCGWEDPNYYLWQKRQRADSQYPRHEQPAEHLAARSGHICPRCGVDVEPGTRRCPNCGWLFPVVRGIERAAPGVAPPSAAEREAVPAQGSQRAVLEERQGMSVPRSPILAEVGRGGGGWREWDFGNIKRLLRPVGAGLLMLGMVVSLAWGVYIGARYIVDRAGGDRGSQTEPVPIATDGSKVYPFSPVVVPPGGGRVVWSPEGNAFKPGTQLTLSAVPAACFVFDHWEGVESHSPEVTIEFDATKTVTAHFKPSDAVPPQITGVRVTRYSDIGATIVWQTDEPAAGRVQYGLTKDSYDETVEEKYVATEHAIDLTGLSPGKTYYFSVTSTDKCGNEASAHEGNFTTKGFVAVGYSVGERAPDFTLPSYRDNHPSSANNPGSPYYIGDRVSLSQFRGKWVFLNLWNTFCAACLGELPHVRAFYEDENWANRNSADAGWAVITVCLDGRTDRIVKLEEKYKYQTGLFTLPILVDDPEKRTLTELYRVTYVPKSLFIDPDGIIRAVKTEQFKSPEQISELAKSLSGTSQEPADAR